MTILTDALPGYFAGFCIDANSISGIAGIKAITLTGAWNHISFSVLDCREVRRKIKSVSILENLQLRIQQRTTGRIG